MIWWGGIEREMYAERLYFFINVLCFAEGLYVIANVHMSDKKYMTELVTVSLHSLHLIRLFSEWRSDPSPI